MATFRDEDVLEVEIIAERDTYEWGDGGMVRFRQRRVEWRLVLAWNDQMDGVSRDDEWIWQPHGIRFRASSVDVRSTVGALIEIDVRAEVVGEVTNEQVSRVLAASRGRRPIPMRIREDEWPTPRAPLYYGPPARQRLEPRWTSIAAPMPPEDPPAPPVPKQAPAKMRERKRHITLDDD